MVLNISEISENDHEITKQKKVLLSDDLYPYIFQKKYLLEVNGAAFFDAL